MPSQEFRNGADGADVVFEVEYIVFFTKMDQHGVYLREVDGFRRIRFSSGGCEASAIHHATKSKSWSRPVPHVLIGAIIEGLDGKARDVIIHGFEPERRVFLAKLHVVYQGNLLSFDVRPSDAITLALYLGLPILVADKVIDQSGR
jgi:bifunctional DNase/RNase